MSRAKLSLQTLAPEEQGHSVSGAQESLLPPSTLLLWAVGLDSLQPGTSPRTSSLRIR